MSDISSTIKAYKCEIAGNVHNLFLPDAVRDIPGEDEKRLFELEHLVDAQSVGFTTDLIPVFQGIIRQIQSRLKPPFGTRYSVLDVGTRTGSGADLIARLFHGYMSIRLDVDVCHLDVSVLNSSPLGRLPGGTLVRRLPRLWPGARRRGGRA